MSPSLAALIVVLLLSALASPVRAQSEASPLPPVDARKPGDGSILGQVFDGETGKPVPGVTVTVTWPAPAGGGEPRQETDVTDAKGAYEFESVPPGVYTLRFAKDGYRDAVTPDFTVSANQTLRADTPLPRIAEEAEEESGYDVEEFVVVASPVDMESLLLRITSDEFLNVLSAEELSRFAAGDVAEGISRMAGVNVVEGQFAIIRGLEDRYSSTLYNGAPVPSPDPDKQSVQLDLFPSDVVSNLVVSKTFAAEQPSNSSGGSINVVTHAYPDKFTYKLGLGAGYNENANERYLKFHGGNPVGSDQGTNPLESDTGGSFGGKLPLGERELRYKAAFNWEIDYDTAEGFVEDREPFSVAGFDGTLAQGELTLSGGRFELTESGRKEQSTGYVGLGTDIDAAGNHRLDGSMFYTHKLEEVVQLKENGTIPGYPYEALAQVQENGNEVSRAFFDGFSTDTAWIARTIRGYPDDPAARGPMWYSNFSESESFKKKRDLLLFQLNGDHTIPQLEGLSVRWAANQVGASQDEDSYGARYFFEPDDPFQIPTEPGRAELLGAGRYGVNTGLYSSANEIDENQYAGLLDFEYERVIFEEVLTLKLGTGGWWERATRDVDSNFLESFTVDGVGQFAILRDDPLALGRAAFDELDAPGGVLAGLRQTTSDATREIKAWSLGGKATFYDDFDLLGGVRLENLFIESRNDPFTGEVNDLDGSPRIFPSANLFFDRPDNPARGEVIAPPPPGTTFNDQILGFKVAVDPNTGLVDLTTREQIESFVNGEIDESRALPAFGINYRPIDGLSLRTAYSQTVARPSFRELGYYVSVEPGTDDLIVGNPQLELSDVTSYDARVEYTWGDFGDLVAVSGFVKKIEKPIESIVVRNPVDFESDSALFRTFFNNPDEASVQGVELEARKNLGFIPFEFFEYLSIGGNYTYIDAEVDRTDIELQRSRAFFGVPPRAGERFSGLETSRRLFGQPEWIANADINFDQPDWGTKATLALFSISDVLDAAGVASLAADGSVQSFTLDRYIDSHLQLDFVLSQTFRVDSLRGDLVLKLSVKNLTDSTRAIIYDPDQTRSKIEERSFKVGRDLALSLTYQY